MDLPSWPTGAVWVAPLGLSYALEQCCGTLLAEELDCLPPGGQVEEVDEAACPVAQQRDGLDIIDPN
ncbi:MAG: hypothetical protein GEU96_11970 [Propionibacteriales bacterium]|nr:hypothetical protein [Propionibacteriales bacterium]